CSQAYLVFFVCVFTVYWVMPWHRGRVWLLLAASFFFYACFIQWLALLIGVSTVADYWLARGIDSGASPGLRKALLLTSLAGNLGLLCYFKYVNFFLSSLESALRGMGATSSIPLLSVIVPIG